MDAMGSYLITEFMKALGEGNVTKGISWLVVFCIIWLEVRGMKKQMKALNETIANSFAAGEKRFETIENDVHQIRVDLDVFKNQLTTEGTT